MEGEFQLLSEIALILRRGGGLQHAQGIHSLRSNETVSVMEIELLSFSHSGGDNMTGRVSSNMIDDDEV